MMDQWRYNAIRVTKYNPLFRDESGKYTADDWVSYSDIGREFNGTILTAAAYSRVEQQYIDAVITILRTQELDKVVIKALEKYPGGELVSDLYDQLEDGIFIDLEHIPMLMKLVLRDYIWCELQIAGDIVIRFGYDFYMYVNGIPKEAGIWQEISSAGLFVD